MSTPILFTIPNFITAGSGRAMLNIIERLDRERFAPAVCVLKRGGRLDGVVERLGIPLLDYPFTIPARPCRSLPLRAWRAARPFRSHGFTLWHSFHYSDDYTEPLIARLAGARGWIYTKKNMNWHRRSWYIRTLLAKRVVAQNSDMLGDFFHSSTFRRKTRLIARGIDATRFAPPVSGARPVRSMLGISDSATVIGCVAHLVPVKGHPTLIEAVARLPLVHLLIAGRPADAVYAAELRRMTTELGVSERVHFLDDVADVPQFWAEAEISVLATWGKWRMEGCPVALLEAMSCGRACVATDIPGSRDLIEHERSGIIVPPEDVGALTAALERLITSAELRHNLGCAARQRVLEHFTIEREVADHEALYSELRPSSLLPMSV